jgi:hypothetical protein
MKTSVKASRFLISELFATCSASLLIWFKPLGKAPPFLNTNPDPLRSTPGSPGVICFHD